LLFIFIDLKITADSKRISKRNLIKM